MFKALLLTVSLLLYPWISVALAQSGDSLPGGAGWASFGLAGLILAWVFLVHLPGLSKALEKMMKDSSDERRDLTARYDHERDIEREARHDRANQFQTMMLKLAATHQVAIREIEEQHRKDAILDRQAFEGRHDKMESCIRQQTLELKQAFTEGLKGLCQAASFCQNFRPKQEQP